MLEGTNSKLGDAEECISNLQDRIMEITQSEQQKEKQILKSENSLRDLLDNIEHINIHIIVGARGKRERKGRKCS